MQERSARGGRKERRGPALGGPARSASPDSPTPPEPKRWWRALSSAGGMAARSSSMPCAYGQCGPARAGASSGKRQGARQAGAPETHHLSRRVGASAQAARKCAQVRHHLGQLAFEIGCIGCRPFPGGHQDLASSWSSRFWKLSGSGSSTTESYSCLRPLAQSGSLPRPPAPELGGGPPAGDRCGFFGVSDFMT